MIVPYSIGFEAEPEGQRFPYRETPNPFQLQYRESASQYQAWSSRMSTGGFLHPPYGG